MAIPSAQLTGHVAYRSFGIFERYRRPFVLARRAILRIAMTREAGEIHDEGRDFGVDLGLIDENLRLPVAERMRRHFERVRMYQRMQERTLTQRELAALREAQVDEAIRAWGSAVPR